MTLDGTLGSSLPSGISWHSVQSYRGHSRLGMACYALHCYTREAYASLQQAAVGRQELQGFRFVVSARVFTMQVPAAVTRQAPF